MVTSSDPRPAPASTSPARPVCVDPAPKSSGRLAVLGDPTARRGPSQGQRRVYFLSPWGMQFRLVSRPGGKAFDRPDTLRDASQGSTP